MSYTETVKAAKLAARDVLRANKVERRLNKIRTLEIDVKHLDKQVAELNELSTVALVEADAMPDNHPYKAREIEAANKTKERNDKRIEGINEQKAAVEKEITDLNTEIAEVESGESKVDYDEMRSLAQQFVSKAYENKFLDGEYDAEAAAEAQPRQ